MMFKLSSGHEIVMTMVPEETTMTVDFILATPTFCVMNKERNMMSVIWFVRGWT